MQVRRLTLALMTAWACLPASGYAAGEYSPAWWIYSVNQACQTWADAMARYFPVAVIGSVPSALAPGLAPHMPTPPATQPSTQPMAAKAGIPGAASTNPYLAYTPYAAPAANEPSVAVSAPPASLTPQAATQATSSQRAEPQPTPTPENPAQRDSVIAAAATDKPTEIAAESSPDAAVEPAVPVPVTAGTVKLEDALTHFEFDKAKLTEAGRAALDSWLAGIPQGLKVRVTGHADRLGPSRYNLALSRRRAESVVRHLSGKSMRPNDIKIVAKGESQPVVSCKGRPTPETKACLAANRRVEIKPR
ncbi:MAG: OmpA family protein [Hydrogenophilales bacterium]|nr:OmpA family protein [Hydrogenophilales bacterium]